jgi:hypothetical protein
MHFSVLHESAALVQSPRLQPPHIMKDRIGIAQDLSVENVADFASAQNGAGLRDLGRGVDCILSSNA